MKSKKRWKKVTIKRKRLIIWGGADQCRVNYYILKHLGCKIEAIIDDTPNMASPFKEVPIFSGESGLKTFLKSLDPKKMGFVIAIGNPQGIIRNKLHIVMKKQGLTPVSFADPTALICKSASYGDGLQVMPCAIIHNDVKIGTQCIINTKAIVEHDCVLDKGVEIGPGAVLCGRVHVGKNSWIGANATIRPRIKIGENTIIGAGAVVVSDIPNNVVAVGVPAKVKRKN